MSFPVNVKVDWPANVVTDPADADQYYEVVVNGAAPQRVDAPVTDLIVSIPAPGTYTFGVSAFNQWGSDGPTTATAKINPAGKPSSVTISKV